MCRVRDPACTARERHINGRSIKKRLHIPFGYIRHSKDRLNANIEMSHVMWIETTEVMGIEMNGEMATEPD